MSDVFGQKKIVNKKFDAFEVKEEFTNIQDFYDYSNKGNEATTISYKKKDYKVFLDSREHYAEVNNILNSDRSLERYYEKNNKGQLHELHSKSFINIPGKKAARKKLRENYLKSLTQSNRAKREMDAYRREKGIMANVSYRESGKMKRKEELDFIEAYYKKHSHSRFAINVSATLGMTDPVFRARYVAFLKKLEEKRNKQ